jgi:hypothetical protein
MSAIPTSLRDSTEVPMPDEATQHRDLDVTVHDEDDGSAYHLYADPETLVKTVVDDLYENHLHRERRPDDRLRCDANGDDVFAHLDERLRQYEETHCRQLVWDFTGRPGRRLSLGASPG